VAESATTGRRSPGRRGARADHPNGPLPVRHPIDALCHLHLTLRDDGSWAIINQSDGPVASSSDQSESDRDPDGIDDHAGSTPGARQVGDRPVERGDQRRRVVKGPPAKAASRRAGGTASSSRGSATAPRAFPALTQRMHLQTV